MSLPVSGVALFAAILFAAESLLPGWLLFLIVIVVLVVPFLLGALIARMLKLKDLSFRIGVVLLTTVLGLTPFVSEVVRGRIEQQQYEAELAEWEARGEKVDGRVTEPGLADLRKEMPELVVTTSTQSDVASQ